jgi:hypothetical protein
MNNQKDYLTSLISDAFHGIELGHGISISQTEVIDDYGTEEERAKAREKDQIKNWPSLVDDSDFLNTCKHSYVTYLDDEGLLFYTPVVMTILVKDHTSCPDEFDTLVSRLISRNNKSDDYPRHIFNDKQIHCLRKFFKYLLNNTGGMFEFEEKRLLKSIESWKT